jgi:hypothetical protein
MEMPVHGGITLQDVLWVTGIVQLQEVGRWYFGEPEII